jgi:hypothetical protein
MGKSRLFGSFISVKESSSVWSRSVQSSAKPDFCFNHRRSSSFGFADIIKEWMDNESSLGKCRKWKSQTEGLKLNTWLTMCRKIIIDVSLLHIQMILDDFWAGYLGIKVDTSHHVAWPNWVDTYLRIAEISGFDVLVALSVLLFSFGALHMNSRNHPSLLSRIVSMLD